MLETLLGFQVTDCTFVEYFLTEPLRIAHTSPGVVATPVGDVFATSTSQVPAVMSKDAKAFSVVLGK